MRQRFFLFTKDTKDTEVSASEPSSFEISIIVNGFIYRYGFEANEKTVTTEWLYKKACRKRAKEVELYYREADKASVHPKYGQALEIVNKKMVRDNALLLSTLAQFNEDQEGVWNGQFHALEQAIPRLGTVNSTPWNRPFQALELSWYHRQPKS